MTIGINTSALISYYQAKAGIISSSSSSTSSSTTSTASAPAAPWTTTPTTTQTSAQIQAAINGQAIINPGAVKLSTTPTTAAAGSNYKNLFALYQGLNTLSDLATQASVSGQTSGQIDQLQKAFANGLAQVNTYLGTTPFTGFQVVQGSDKATQQTTVAAAPETDTYTTGTVYAGGINTPVPSLEGDVSFSATVTEPYSASKTINFNLDDMGSTPRTIGNVTNYLNAQLKAAGVATQFSVVDTPGVAQTIAVAGGKTVTLPAGPDQFSLKINGNSLETLTFSAPNPTPAVYVAQTAGLAASATTSSSSSTTSTTTTTSTTSSTSSTSTATPAGTSLATQQLIKLDPSSNTKVFTDALGATVTNVTATATGADGSVYVLGDIDGATTAGETDGSQTIAGTQDVALLKYNSAGNLLTTSVLGAANSASGLALAVSADGTQVAVAGTVTGALNGTTTPASSDVPDSFVKVYDSSGNPLWTARQNATFGDQVNSVAFGANGAVYVGGTTSSSLTGAAITGQTAAYLTGYSSSGKQTFSTQIGTAGFNTINGIAVDGSTIVTAGAQNGDAVVNSFTIPTTGTPTLTASRDLGALQGGSVAGVAVNSDGSVVVAGSTHNGALSAGAVTTAYSSGEEAFVAQLSSSSLTPSSSDTLTYYKGSGDTTASAVTVAGGQVYIAGQVSVTPTGGEKTAYDGYVAQINTSDGSVAWSNQITSANNESAPHSIAVDPTGSSALDLLGLPTGTIDNAPNANLVANSSLVAGNSFTVSIFGVARTVTIAANDTLQTLATKIQQASGYQATTKVATTNGVQELTISPSNSQSSITLGSGPAGQDALSALGLTAGEITTATTITSKTSTLKTSYGLNLPSTLSLTSTANIAAATAALKSATGTVASIYLNMTTPPASKTASKTSGTVPAYLTAEIANYQSGLNRLLSGSSSSTSSTASLFSS